MGYRYYRKSDPYIDFFAIFAVVASLSIVLIFAITYPNKQKAQQVQEIKTKA